MSRSSTPRWWPALGLALTLLAGMAGCDGDSGGMSSGDTDHEAAAAFRYALPAGTGTTLSLEGVTGSIEIGGETGLDSVVIAGQRRVMAGSQEEAHGYLDSLRVEVTPAAAGIGVRTVQPRDTRGRQYTVDYAVLVPPAWAVAVVNVTGNIEARSRANRLDLRCTTGRITVRQCAGDVAADLVTGDLELKGIHGNLEASGVTGNLVAEATLPDRGICDLRMVTGNLVLAIPRATSATLSARVVTGLVSVTGLSLDGASAGSTLVTGTLGSGSGRIRLEVVTGSLRVDGF